jgi:hypothetical protein
VAGARARPDLPPCLAGGGRPGRRVGGLDLLVRRGTTDSFGPELRAVTNGIALLPYGNGVHYDSEERRRPTVHRLVAAGTLPLTHCSDDGVGLVYRGTELVEAVTEQRGKGAYVVHRDGDRAVEERLEPRLLPGV